MTDHTETETRQVLNELQDEFGAALALRAERDSSLRTRSRVRRFGPLLGVAALAGGGAGVAIAATENGFDEPPPQVDPALVAIGMGPDGELIRFGCEAESKWFFAAIGGDLKQFDESGAELPVSPDGICDGEVPIGQAP